MKHALGAWRPAIDVRRSRRTYDRRPLTQEQTAKLRTLCREFTPFDDARVEFVEDAPGLFAKGDVGYGTISGARSALVFIGRVKSPQSDLHAGYLGEAAVLEASRLGLGTCWTHRMYSPSVVSAHCPLDYGERVVAASPVGFVPSAPSIGERLQSSRSTATGKLPVADIATSECLTHAHGMYRDALEAARLAPSPLNRQIWRFSLEEDGRLCLSLASGPELARCSKRIDAGIAMLHVDVAAAAAGHDGRWETCSGPPVARWRPKINVVNEVTDENDRRHPIYT
jgi:nitroreductase